MLDILISGGKYPDFAKNELVEANVGIEKGKIAFIEMCIRDRRYVY